MKFLHLSDLHLGKRVNEFSMLEDQAYILESILNIIDDTHPDGVIIAGDVYDKSVPSSEAITLFDDFLVALSNRALQVFIISGNHDSPERLSFASRLIDRSGIHIAPVYNGNVTPIALNDDFGTVSVYMLPFVKPVHVRRFFEEENIETYSDAMKVAIEKMAPNYNERNILITHQFVTGASRSESEEISVGGTDNVDASVLDGFDYVALGHLHKPQNCGNERIRYCGTPLKYSFSESRDHKSVTIIDIKEKDNISIDTVPLLPLHDMREIKGSYDELMSKSFYENTTYCTDYMHITLTDELDVPDALGKLRTVYRNLMRLDYDNTRTRCNREIIVESNIEAQSPKELFSSFFYMQNNQELSEEQEKLLSDLIESIWEEKK